jgi:hypothetical protein
VQKAAPVGPTPVRALEIRLARSLGREVATPQGAGVLHSVEGGVAIVVMEQRYTVAFSVEALVGLDDEMCALCSDPATEWCAACGQPVCAAHQGHGVAAAPTPFMLDKVLARLVRYGQATVREAEIAYAVADLAQSRHMGGVDVLPPQGARKGLRPVLRPA